MASQEDRYSQPVQAPPYSKVGYVSTGPEQPGIMNRLQQLRGQAEQLISMVDALSDRLSPLSLPQTPTMTVEGNFGVGKQGLPPSPVGNDLDMIGGMLLRIEQTLRDINQKLDF